MQPIFVANREDLKSHLRLTDAKINGDLEATLDRAITWARVRLYEEIGSTRMTAVRALTPVADPTTADELARVAGDLLEVELVRCFLLDNLPTVFADAAGETQQQWNEDGTFRNTDSFDRNAMRQQCLQTIERLVETVLGAGEEDHDEDVRVSIGGTGDETKCSPPAGTVLPGARVFTGNHVLLPLSGNRFGTNNPGVS